MSSSTVSKITSAFYRLIVKCIQIIANYLFGDSLSNYMESSDKMSEQILKCTPQNAAELFSKMEGCFNNTTIYQGDAKNINAQFVNNLYLTKESTNVKLDDLPLVVEQTVLKEAFPNDEPILKLIFNHLSFDEKLNCSLVCKRFNKIISDIDCFRLVVKFKSMVHIIPKLSRNYKTVTFQRYQCDSLVPLMHQMLQQLSHRVIDLTLDGCQFDLIALCNFLREFPLLKSLQLNVFLTIDKNVHLSVEDLPNCSQLKDFKIKVNSDKLNETFDITGSASNIKSLSLFDAVFDINLLSHLRQYKCLESLRLTKCVMNTFEVSNLKSLHFDSSVKFQPENYKRFNILENLRELELIEVNDKLLRILESKCAHEVTDFKIVYNHEQSFDVHYYFHVFIFEHDYFVDSDSVEDFDKLINVGYEWPVRNMTFFNEREPYGDVLVYDMLQEGQTKIQFNFTKNDKTKNLDDYVLILSFKIRPIQTYDNELKERKLEYFKRIISSFPICKTHFEENTTEECDGTRTDCIVRHRIQR